MRACGDIESPIFWLSHPPSKCYAFRLSRYYFLLDPCNCFQRWTPVQWSLETLQAHYRRSQQSIANLFRNRHRMDVRCLFTFVQTSEHRASWISFTFPGRLSWKDPQIPHGVLGSLLTFYSRRLLCLGERHWRPTEVWSTGNAKPKTNHCEHYLLGYDQVLRMVRNGTIRLGILVRIIVL